MLYNHKLPKTFHSAIWDSYTNPDLTFYSRDLNSLAPHPTHSIGGNFPRSQHRPTIIRHPAIIEYTPTTPIPRWNFNKADWDKFESETSKQISRLPDPESADITNSHAEFQNYIYKIALNTIPRGYRTNYIPGWDRTCTELSKAHESAKTLEEKQTTANNLINHINERRKTIWKKTVETIDMKHSSRKAWSTLNKLTGRKTYSPSRKPIQPNAIAKHLIDNGKFKNCDKEFTRNVNRKLKAAWNSPSADQDLCSNFSVQEVKSAIRSLKPGKSPGPDELHPQFFLHLGDSCIRWLTAFLSTCLRLQRIPKIWKTAKVIAVLKPNKPEESPSSYRPISLLCISFKLLERLICNRIQPVVESILPPEQAGFRPARSTLDQVSLLTEDIEAAFEKREKVGAVFVDLTAAYDTVWLRGLTLKLLETIPSKEMVHMIMQMIRERSFVLHLGDKKSKQRRLANGVPQGSVLAPTLFNIYIADLPLTTSKKYTYADDIALAYNQKDFFSIESALTADIETLTDYFHKWRLRLNTSKTVCSMFHLANRLADYKPKIYIDKKQMPFEESPKYLGVVLDRSLTFRQHITMTAAKVNARCNLLKRVATNKWGADFHVLRTSALALCFSAAEYCAPVWARSVHTAKIDTSLHDCLRLISGSIKPTPVELLPNRHRTPRHPKRQDGPPAVQPSL